LALTGSLDAPPIVMQSDSDKVFRLFRISVGFTVLLGLVLFFSPHLSVSYKVLLWFSFVVLLLGSALFLVMLFRPASIEISPDGLKYFTGLLHLQTPWSNITQFRYTQRGKTGMIGIDCRPDAPLPRWRPRAISDEWPMELPALADLLNAALVRWGNASPP
jgi:hypothetical protein